MLLAPLMKTIVLSLVLAVHGGCPCVGIESADQAAVLLLSRAGVQCTYDRQSLDDRTIAAASVIKTHQQPALVG
jgi:hypothetical protein